MWTWESNNVKEDMDGNRNLEDRRDTQSSYTLQRERRWKNMNLFSLGLSRILAATKLVFLMFINLTISSLCLICISYVSLHLFCFKFGWFCNIWLWMILYITFLSFPSLFFGEESMNLKFAKPICSEVIVMHSLSFPFNNFKPKIFATPLQI